MRQKIFLAILSLVATSVTAQKDVLVASEGTNSTPQYDVVVPAQGGWRLVHGLAGAEVLDSAGHPVFDWPPPVLKKPRQDGYIQMQRKESVGLIDSAGRLILAPLYDWVGQYQGNCAPIVRNGKSGLVDRNGNMVLPPEYRSIQLLFDKHYDYWSRDRAPACAKNIWVLQKADKLAFVHANSIKAAEPEFDAFRGFGPSGIRGIVIKDGKTGFIDTSCQLVVEPVYDMAQHYEHGLSFVKKDGRFGLIDLNGNIVIPVRYDRFSSFGESGIAQFSTTGTIIYVDTTGTVVPDPYNQSRIEPDEAPPTLFEISPKPAQPGAALPAVEKSPDSHSAQEKRHDYVETFHSEIVLPAQYDSVGPFTGGHYLVRKGDAYSFVEVRDGQLTDTCPDSGVAFDPETGWQRVRREGKWGWIDAQGEERIPCRFDAATAFHNGRARVVLRPFAGTLWINTQGEVLLGW